MEQWSLDVLSNYLHNDSYLQWIIPVTLISHCQYS